MNAAFFLSVQFFFLILLKEETGEIENRTKNMGTFFERNPFYRENLKKVPVRK